MSLLNVQPWFLFFQSHCWHQSQFVSWTAVQCSWYWFLPTYPKLHCQVRWPSAWKDQVAPAVCYNVTRDVSVLQTWSSYGVAQRTVFFCCSVLRSQTWDWGYGNCDCSWTAIIQGEQEEEDGFHGFHFVSDGNESIITAELTSAPIGSTLGSILKVILSASLLVGLEPSPSALLRLRFSVYHQWTLRKFSSVS